MPFPRPTLQSLQRRVVSDVAASTGRGPLLSRSVLYQLSQAVAGAAHSLFGFIDWVFRQTFPDTAEAENLDRWADTYGTPRLPATFAAGSVEFTGNTGVIVRSGTRVVRADGALFELAEDQAVVNGSVAVPASALEAGLAGNCEAGEVLQLVSPVEGLVNSAIVGGAGIGGGADVEADEALRVRVIRRLRNPGQGGNAADYERWALEVPGVTRAFVHPVLNGLGTVGVSVMRDGDDDPFPVGAALAAVQAYIDLRRPVGMVGVEVFAPTPLPVDLEIRLEPDTIQLRELATAALGTLFIREGGPVPRQVETFLPLSRISESISSVAGERSHQVLSPTAPPSVGPRGLLTLGVITWS